MKGETLSKAVVLALALLMLLACASSTMLSAVINRQGRRGVVTYKTSGRETEDADRRNEALANAGAFCLDGGFELVEERWAEKDRFLEVLCSETPDAGPP